MSGAPNNNWSLKRRLLGRVVIGVGLGWLLGLGIGLWIIAHEMGELLDESLKDSAHLSAALYQASGSAGLHALDVSSDIRIIDHGREVIAAEWPPLDEDGGQTLGEWRVYRLSDPGIGLIVETGQSSEWRRDELLESMGSMLLLMLPILLITLLVVGRATTSALRPATRFAEELKSRKATDLSPVSAAALPREVAPIPAALNNYLQRLRNHINAERLFATNAAHELRTPIAAASAQAQLMARGMADPDAPKRMTAALDRLALLVERLLQLSRAEAGVSGEATCDIVRLTRIAIADTCPEAVFDDGDQERMMVPVHHDAAGLMIGNLLRNARDHGIGGVKVRLGAGPTLTISNRVAPNAEFLHGIFERSAASRGTGLGLGIVTKIAEKEGVALRFTIKDERAEVELVFPTGD